MKKFYDFGARLVCVYTCQNATLLEITCPSSDKHRAAQSFSSLSFSLHASYLFTLLLLSPDFFQN